MIHVHIKRRLMKELPETEDGVAQWCKDVFVAKDDMLDKHLAEDTFGDQQFQDIGRPKKSLLVVISWSTILVLLAFKFFQWSSLLSSWKGIGISAAALLVVIAVMHIFIEFSQAERSTSAKVAPSQPKNGMPSETSREKQN